MRKNSLLLLTFLFVYSFAGAQSLVWSDGSLTVVKTTEGSYEKKSATAVFTGYDFTDSGEIWVSSLNPDGSTLSKTKVAYTTETDGRLSFYSASGNEFVGFFLPSSGRFFDAKSGVAAELKDNGEVITADGQLLFRIENGRPEAEVTGFFVFFNY